MAKSKSSASTIFTVLLAVAAVIVIILVLVLNSVSKGKQSGLTSEQTAELQSAAQTLVASNYQVFTIFYSQGLATEKEPYDIPPADGMFTVKSDEFATYADLEKLVNDTYISTEATRILTAPNDKGAIYADRNGKLGMKKDNFVKTEYTKKWDGAKLEIIDAKPDSATLTITVKTDSGADEALTATLVKENDKWLLEKLVS